MIIWACEARERDVPKRQRIFIKSYVKEGMNAYVRFAFSCFLKGRLIKMNIRYKQVGFFIVERVQE